MDARIDGEVDTLDTAEAALRRRERRTLRKRRQAKRAAAAASTAAAAAAEAAGVEFTDTMRRQAIRDALVEEHARRKQQTRRSFPAPPSFSSSSRLTHGKGDALAAGEVLDEDYDAEDFENDDDSCGEDDEEDAGYAEDFEVGTISTSRSTGGPHTGRSVAAPPSSSKKHHRTSSRSKHQRHTDDPTTDGMVPIDVGLDQEFQSTLGGTKNHHHHGTRSGNNKRSSSKRAGGDAFNADDVNRAGLPGRRRDSGDATTDGERTDGGLMVGRGRSIAEESLPPLTGAVVNLSLTGTAPRSPHYLPAGGGVSPNHSDSAVSPLPSIGRGQKLPS